MNDIAVFVSTRTELTIVISHNEVICIDENGETTMLGDGAGFADEALRTNWLRAAAGRYAISRDWRRVL